MPDRNIATATLPHSAGPPDDLGSVANPLRHPRHQKRMAESDTAVADVSEEFTSGLPTPDALMREGNHSSWNQANLGSHGQLPKICYRG